MILTFLGKGGVGRSTLAIATAKSYAEMGSRVLIVSSDPTPAFSLLLGVTLSSEIQPISANLSAVQLQTTHLLEKGWEKVKEYEGKYLRSPVIKNVFGQELGILPGMDQAFALDALREYRQSSNYDLIIYDGDTSLNTLRMIGTPEILSWYIRRFRQLFQDSDIVKALSPFVQPVTSAVLNVSWNADNFADEPTQETTQFLEEGKKAMADPNQILAYLVAGKDQGSIETAKYLWASAQQVGLTVGGIILNQGTITPELEQTFSPLKLTSIPTSDNWSILGDALPRFKNLEGLPKSIEIDINTRQVKIFLPTLDKKQVKLTQYGPEITIEAGDQRRNIFLPPSLSGQPVKGAKFQDGYLIISL